MGVLLLTILAGWWVSQKSAHVSATSSVPDADGRDVEGMGLTSEQSEMKSEGHPATQLVSGNKAQIILQSGQRQLDQIGSPETAVSQDARVVYELVEAYVSLVKPEDGWPTGLNEEVVAVLQGNNEWGIPFIPKSHPALDEAGRLCDRWGTPLFFHAQADDRVEVMSAGPDGEMWSEDDLVFPEPESDVYSQ